MRIPYKLKNIHYDEGKDNKDFWLNGPPKDKPIYITGLFLSYKHLIPIRKILLSEFSFKNDIPESVGKILDDIKSSESVSLHVRRGDFMDSETTFRIFGSICTLQYYINSVNYIKAKYPASRFFIFTNDIQWVKTNFTFLENYYIVDTSKEYPPDYYDLFLMTQTKHNIIPNSTFSWWGAWLNQNQSKIVTVPERWFGDNSRTTEEVCPPEWIRIPSN
jgi:hypothetical protein